jgi:hypothetical protein
MRLHNSLEILWLLLEDFPKLKKSQNFRLQNYAKFHKSHFQSDQNMLHFSYFYLVNYTKKRKLVSLKEFITVHFC